jgi:hypothetical protein
MRWFKAEISIIIIYSHQRGCPNGSRFYRYLSDGFSEANFAGFIRHILNSNSQLEKFLFLAPGGKISMITAPQADTISFPFAH